MKRVLILLAILATFAMADNNGVEGRVTTLENQMSGVLATEPAINSTDGLDGTNGIDGALLQELEDATLLSMAALSSVELNPDHTGFSMGIGLSMHGTDAAGAIGMMYSFPTDTNGVTLGVNLKAFTSKSGTDGASGGLTLGF